MSNKTKFYMPECAWVVVGVQMEWFLNIDHNGQGKMKSKIIIVRLAGLVSLALGTYFPIARTSSGQTFSIVGTPVWIICFAVAVAALVAIFTDEMPQSVSRKANWISIGLLVSICGYATVHFIEGLNFFLYQTAGDMAGYPDVKKDEYWSTLYSLAGINNQSIPMFGDLRAIYEKFGDQFTFNGQYLFWNVVNGLSKDDARKLTSLAGGNYFVFPAGIVLIFLGTVAYTVPMHRLRFSGGRDFLPS